MLVGCQVLPNAWVLKLKDMRKKKQRSPDPAIDVVSPDPGPFFPKPVARHSFRKQSPNRVFSPVRPNDLHGFGEPRCSSPVNHKAFDIPHPFAASSPAKNLMRTPSPRRTPSKTPPHPRGQNYSPIGIEAGCTYKSTTTLFRRLATNELEAAATLAETPAKKESQSAGSFKVATRVKDINAANRTRHGSLDMDVVECAFDIEKCLKRAEKSTRERQSSGDHHHQEKEDPWSVELSKGALVKQQLFLKKRRESTKMQTPVENPWGTPEMPPVLSEFRSKLAISDPVSQWIAQTPEPSPAIRASFREAPNAIDHMPRSLSNTYKKGGDSADAATQAGEQYYEKLLRPNSWGSCSSLASDESMFTTSFEVPASEFKNGSSANQKTSHWSTSDSSGITSSAEMDRAIKNFNSLEDNALLTVDQAATLLTVGSRFCREAEEATLNTLNDSSAYLSDVSEERHSAPSSNLVRLESDAGSLSRSVSPNSLFHNSPALSSQEALAKTWTQIEFPLFDTDSAGAMPGPFDMTRETYYNGANQPVELQISSLSAHVRREARRANRLADIEAYASAQRKSASRQKGNKSVSLHAEITANPKPKAAAAKSNLSLNSSSRRISDVDIIEQAKGIVQRHQRRFSKEEVSMPPELNGVVKESVALVKNSDNPYSDFKESMTEMILEKNIQESGDLEELLQCYLSLNCEDYHNVIVEVFTEVWREIFESNA